MSLSAQITPASKVLCGNPVKLSISTSARATYAVTVAGTLVYTGSGDGTFHVFLGDIISPYLSPQLCYNNDVRLVIPVSCSAACVVSVSNTAGNSATINFTAYLGGVSKRTLRYLAENNTSIFTSKLCDYSRNFAMTTRTDDNIIIMRETEISPLLCLYPESGTMSVQSAGVAIELAGTAGALCAINLYQIRKQLFVTNGKLSSVFDIYVGSVMCFRVMITPSALARERYYLRFLNSYAAYELLEVTGVGNMETEYNEEDVYESYDDVVDDYVRQRSKQKSRHALKVESGFKRPDEIEFCLDLLSSNDVCLLGYEGGTIKVHPTCDNLSRLMQPLKPQSIQFTLRFAEEESNHTHSLLDDRLGDTRIHTEQFTEQFN